MNETRQRRRGQTFASPNGRNPPKARGVYVDDRFTSIRDVQSLAMTVNPRRPGSDSKRLSPILLVFGPWMFPLGLILHAGDTPIVRRGVTRGLDWLENRWPRWFAGPDAD